MGEGWGEYPLGLAAYLGCPSFLPPPLPTCPIVQGRGGGRGL